MRNSLSILLLLIVPLINTKAEIIDGPANVREQPNGVINYVLNNNQYVYAHELSDNWFKLTVTALVKKEDLQNDTLISKGALLYGQDYATPIGNTESRLNISGYTMETENEDFIEVMLFGYTFKNNIKVESILEREVERILNHSILEDLPILKKKFNFNEYQVGEYYVWTTYDWENPWGSADFRMMIYFNSDKKIIGVANINRKLSIKKKSESTIDRNYRMQYIIDMPEKEQKIFEDLMTRAFATRD